ncbi:MAG: vitamin K epoxide reductase family protein, partial [Nanoarchaeota archaeon]
PIPLIDIADQHFLLDLLTSNAFLGFLTLLLVFCMSFAYTHKRDFWFIKKNTVLSWMRGLLTFGIIYGLYLVYIQHFILKSYCIFCFGLDVILIVSCIFVWREHQ